jgi:peptidoglycan/LPS O-acetylase OafA/YrhL
MLRRATDPSRDGAIDELRGMAFLAVLASHVGLVYGLDLSVAYVLALPALGVGVDFFFVISGFVIARNFRAMTAMAAGDIFLAARGFWLRRFIRIALPLWVTAAMIAVCRATYGPHESYGDLAAASAFYANLYWADCFAGDHGSCPDPLVTSHFWSIALEMQFYALMPLVLAPPRRWACVGLGVTLALGAALQRPVGGLLWSLRPDAFLLGVALADPVVAQWRGRTPGISLIQTCYWILVAASFERIAQGPLSGLALLIVAIVSTYVVAARMNAGASPSAVGRWLRKLGQASYAAYLTHLPILTSIHNFLASRAAPTISLIFALSAIGVTSVFVDWFVVRPAASTARKLSIATIGRRCKMSYPA